MFVLGGLVISLTACGALGDIDRSKRYKVNSPSMEPTIAEGSVVTAKVVKPGDYQPRVGDIVVFDPPDSYGWNPDGAPRISRVVAVAGDTVACCDAQGRIFRNGTVQDEPYVKEPAFSTAFEHLTVPAGKLYLLGDLRGAANDSSHNGPVAAGNVIGIIKR
ncbi:signal peptidase I [Salinispora vitiensis]|uniref:signal peptidase I n=1 Tax=Salinispora vitiensis TaxID=999544 RepID=UPI00039A526E|nr:signal peptidase I [Salinispora vitiensis]